jgi:hypothetical protein
MEEDIRKLPKAQLDLIDHDIYKWHCCAEGCKGFTRIRDYGESPFYYHRKGWYDLTHYWWLCSKHWPMDKKGIQFPLKEDYYGISNIIFEKSVTFLGTQSEQT